MDKIEKTIEDKVELNDWELDIDRNKRKVAKEYNFERLYEHAHAELSLQQTKRDQIITIYLALCSFFIPFVLGEEVIPWNLKGALFIVVGVVGILFAFSTIRYRVYKEIYWLCCQSITVLQNFKQEELDKLTVQKVFYYCLNKKGHGYLIGKENHQKFNEILYTKKNMFSAETLHFMVISIMTSVIIGLGVGAVLTNYSIILGILVALLIFAILLYKYFKECIRIYKSLETKVSKEERNSRFNNVFSKAWFLHFYS